MIKKVVTIHHLKIDADGLLLVKTDESYDHIYRAAAGIDWDAASSSLVCPVPRERSYFDWFRHLCGAVESEYGDRFQLVSGTEWSNIAPALKAEITGYLSGSPN